MKKLIFILFTCVILQVNSKEVSLVCIHGFLGGKWSMHFMAKNLSRQGYNVINWHYPSRLKNIEDHGEDLALMLNGLAKKHPKKPIYFLAHSMGSLVLRSALNHVQCPFEAKIGKCVLVAPPNRGSAWARWLRKFTFARKIAKNFAGFEMMQNEGFDHLGNFPESLDILVLAGNGGFNPFISGENDGTVSVEETRLDTPHKHMVIRRGHKSMIFSKKAFNLIDHFFHEL